MTKKTPKKNTKAKEGSAKKRSKKDDSDKTPQMTLDELPNLPPVRSHKQSKKWTPEEVTSTLHYIHSHSFFSFSSFSFFLFFSLFSRPFSFSAPPPHPTSFSCPPVPPHPRPLYHTCNTSSSFHSHGCCCNIVCGSLCSARFPAALFSCCLPLFWFFLAAIHEFRRCHSIGGLG
eukprot:TRINITY_DN2972_c0_g1_i1.p1 TRINITY_DN2972_c0_g1~~TRINITY_DN2972_c0_g1_i1.p1  ORF type:complete len:174 (-),score=8.98 TRINITY_DN2972_c0_g1_i1:252-773(-)